MPSRVHATLDAAIRARDFCRAHPFEAPVHSGLALQLAEGVAQARSLTAQEHTGHLEAQAAARERKVLRREAQALLASLTRVVVRQETGLASGFKLPSSHDSGALFLARAWGLVSMAREHQDRLAAQGLAGAALDHLAGALTRLEAVTERLGAGRRMEVEARAELAGVAGDLLQLVRWLDALNRARFRNDPETLADWERACSEADAPWEPDGEPGSAEAGRGGRLVGAA